MVVSAANEGAATATTSMAATAKIHNFLIKLPPKKTVPHAGIGI
jgi:hypothetical protein